MHSPDSDFTALLLSLVNKSNADLRCRYVQRKRELEAAAPVKRKRVEPFVKVPRWWVVAACKATDNHKALVCVELLYVAWKAKSLTFPLSNARVEKLGVHRETKRRALRDLEGAGLIRVERQSNKTPIVTVLLL